MKYNLTVAMNVLLTPFPKRIGSPCITDELISLRDLRAFNSNDGFGRVNGDQLNFATPSEDEADYPAGAFVKKGKVSRQDPMSHRIIEKRRRDRMNNCLADLSRLIPPEYLKKGRGRVEKTEIIEMAIRHLKFLQDRANVEQQSREDNFRAGFTEAMSEVVRFLVEVHGCRPGDGLCVQLASHLRRHCETVTKREVPPPEKPAHPMATSSETTSSSNSSNGYQPQQGVIQNPPGLAYPTDYENERQDTYAMECDRVQSGLGEGEAESDEPLPLDGRRMREPSLRDIRKPEHTDDFLQSYKFKNSIERRFSRSQDEAAELVARGAYAHSKAQKRRRALKPAPSTSTSASGSTEDPRDTSPQDTSSESQNNPNHYDKPPSTTQYVPIFALNSHGKYYIPLSVDYTCLEGYLRAYDVLDGPAAHHTTPLHPVTIHVNFQPCVNYHVKRESNGGDWRAA